MSGRIGPFVFAAALPLGTALALLPGEFSHYKRWLELGADETALRLAVLVAILSKTFAVLLAGIALLAVAVRFTRPRSLRLLSLAMSVLVLGFLALDLELQKNTGNGIGHYLPFLFDPDTFRWAGRGFEVGSSLIDVGEKLVLGLLPASALAWLLEGWVIRSSARRGRIAVSALATLASLPLVAAPLVLHLGGSPGYLYHLSERMPWTWYAGVSTGNAAMEASQNEAQKAYTRALSGSRAPRKFALWSANDKPEVTPDLLIVIVESLRYDVLDSETMPRVWDWSQRGVRFESHYSTSNASHYGLFALLYGRNPLRYFETLESGEPPTLISQLREWGYTTHYVTCADIHWRGMDRFMGPRHFSVQRMQGDSLEDCDRDVVARAVTLLEPGDRSPRLVLVFLMSTHFGYHYPEDREPFVPALSPPNVLALRAGKDRSALMNRYRNSAHYVDSLIGSLFDRVPIDDLLAVVTGDHGESLFDDGTIAHSSLLSEIQTRVPFAMSGPGVQPERARRGLTDHSDLLPTIWARLGIGAERLTAYPGQDLFGAVGSEFVALVHAKARRGGVDRVALVSSEHRYAIRLDPARGEIRFLGKLGVNGRPSRMVLSQAEGRQAVGWIDRYLESLASP